VPVVAMAGTAVNAVIRLMLMLMSITPDFGRQVDSFGTSIVLPGSRLLIIVVD